MNRPFTPQSGLPPERPLSPGGDLRFLGVGFVERVDAAGWRADLRDTVDAHVRAPGAKVLAPYLPLVHAPPATQSVAAYGYFNASPNDRFCIPIPNLSVAPAERARHEAYLPLVTGKMRVAHDGTWIVQHGTKAFIAVAPDGSITLSNANGSLLHLDVTNGQAVLVDEHGNSVTLDDAGVRIIDHWGNVLELKDGAVQVLCDGNVVVNASGDCTLKTASVTLGDGATERAVLGDAFIAALDGHVHVSAAPGQPTTPPSAFAAIPDPPGALFGNTPGLLSDSVKVKS